MVKVDNLSKKRGEKFKEAREELSLTQEQVAKEAKIHVNHYAKIERGEVSPTYNTLQKLIKALKANPADFLG